MRLIYVLTTGMGKPLGGYTTVRAIKSALENETGEKLDYGVLEDAVNGTSLHRPRIIHTYGRHKYKLYVIPLEQ